MGVHDGRPGLGRFDGGLRRSASGVRGTCGLRSWVAPEPVTAQVMKTSRVMVSGMVSLLLTREIRFLNGCAIPFRNGTGAIA
jgi:hypothetical protein